MNTLRQGQQHSQCKFLARYLDYNCALVFLLSQDIVRIYNYCGVL